MASFKEELKRPMDWKSVIIIAIAIVGFTKGCGNEFISAHPDVRRIQQLEATIKKLEATAEKLDNSVRNLDIQVAKLEATQQ